MAMNMLKVSTLALSVGMALVSLAQAQPGDRGAAVARLAAESGGRTEVSFHSATGTAQFVRAPRGGDLVGSRAGALTDAAKQKQAMEFFANHGDLFGVTNAASELTPDRPTKDRYGHTRIVHQQVHHGVPVFGGELRAHFDAAHRLIAVSGTFVPEIDVDVTPTRSAAQAAASAIAHVKADLTDGQQGNLSASTPKLVVYREGLAKGTPGSSHLAWHMVVGNGTNVREIVFVSAHSGKVIERFTGIHDGMNRRAFDGAGSTTEPGPNYPANAFWVEGQLPYPTGNTEADNMLFASKEIYDLFKNAFGRDSFNGAGARMDSIFNRGWGCVNASWNGTYISFCPGTTTDDVTAHEWGHAYTEYTHGLIYAWQSGALNESYSDIWGETVDRINGRGTDTPDNPRTAGACTVSTTLPTSTIVNSPAALAGSYLTGVADFGAQSYNLTSNVALVKNTSGQAGTGCDASTFANPGDVAGKIALVARGTCGFAVKALNAQNAGAIGVIISNNQGGTTVNGMTGGSAANTIPTVMISQAAGAAWQAQLLNNVVVNASVVRGVKGTDNSVRWLMGEDSSAFGGAIRDMYNPTCYNNPGKVTDAQYFCAAAANNNTDQGGVHTNSGVPNHAYALIVDGGTYNGQTITGVGLTKAAHMYYRAQTVYQGPTSDFAAHADAIEQSCRDLTGANLNDLKTGAPSGQVISASDCAQVAKAMLAVEMRTPPAQCNFQPVLAKTPPAQCASGSPTVIAGDSFDGGRVAGLRWTVSNGGNGAGWTPQNFGVVKNLPGGRAGYAMFAADPNTVCDVDHGGLQRLESPEITIPAGTANLRMSFDHYIASEAGWDGGNLKISVNGGAWTLVNGADFVYNRYNTTLVTAGQGNSNPLAGQAAFTGTDGGSNSGSWGRSIINLSPYAVAGDKIKLRFEMGNDFCSGAVGWYIDDVSVYRCPAP